LYLQMQTRTKKILPEWYSIVWHLARACNLTPALHCISLLFINSRYLNITLKHKILHDNKSVQYKSRFWQFHTEFLVSPSERFCIYRFVIKNSFMRLRHLWMEIISYTYSIKTIHIKSLKPNGNYMSHLLQQSETFHFVFMGFVWLSV
jgi:hypothetical protein